MCDLVKESCGVDFSPFILCGDLVGARHAAVQHASIPGEVLKDLQSAGEVLNYVFEERCEANLVQPTFVTDHPVEVSPLAKPHRSKQGLVERFEMFMVGREHANAFSELTDPIDQRARFNVQVGTVAESVLRPYLLLRYPSSTPVRR
jgi:lysyl-tRNA synthetase class 2